MFMCVCDHPLGCCSRSRSTSTTSSDSRSEFKDAEADCRSVCDSSSSDLNEPFGVGGGFDARVACDLACATAVPKLGCGGSCRSACLLPACTRFAGATSSAEADKLARGRRSSSRTSSPMCRDVEWPFAFWGTSWTSFTAVFCFRRGEMTCFRRGEMADPCPGTFVGKARRLRGVVDTLWLGGAVMRSTGGGASLDRIGERPFSDVGVPGRRIDDRRGSTPIESAVTNVRSATRSSVAGYRRSTSDTASRCRNLLRKSCNGRQNKPCTM